LPTPYTADDLGIYAGLIPVFDSRSVTVIVVTLFPCTTPASAAEGGPGKSNYYGDRDGAGGGDADHESALGYIKYQPGTRVFGNVSCASREYNHDNTSIDRPLKGGHDINPGLGRGVSGATGRTGRFACRRILAERSTGARRGSGGGQAAAARRQRSQQPGQLTYGASAGLPLGANVPSRPVLITCSAHALSLSVGTREAFLRCWMGLGQGLQPGVTSCQRVASPPLSLEYTGVVTLSFQLLEANHTADRACQQRVPQLRYLEPSGSKRWNSTPHSSQHGGGQ